MRTPSALLLVFALAACRTAPVAQVGPGEYLVGATSLSGFKSDAEVTAAAMRRAQAYCARAGATARLVESKSSGTQLLTAQNAQVRFSCVPRPQERSSEPAAVSEQANAAGGAWLDCLIADEPLLDDLISDAATVASTLATHCTPQFEAYREQVAKSSPSDARGDVDRVEERVRADIAREVVLMARAKLRNPAAKPPLPALPR